MCAFLHRQGSPSRWIQSLIVQHNRLNMSIAMHSARSKHRIKVVSKNAQFYFLTKLKADLNRWKFNIELFPDWQQFNFRFRRNTVMRQKCYPTLATGRVWLISY